MGVVSSIAHVFCARQGEPGAEIYLLNVAWMVRQAILYENSVQGWETTFWEKGGLSSPRLRPHTWLTSFQSPWTRCAPYCNSGVPAVHPSPPWGHSASFHGLSRFCPSCKDQLTSRTSSSLEPSLRIQSSLALWFLNSSHNGHFTARFHP